MTVFFSGALIISSGLLLHMCVSAMLLVEPQPEKHNSIFQETKLEIPDKTNGIMTNHNEDNKKIVIHQSVKSMTLSIFSNLHFILLMLNTFMFLFGTAVVFTHIMAFAKSEGISASFSNVMVSALGLFSILGRVGLGSLSQLPWINTIWLYIFGVFFCGNYQPEYCCIDNFMPLFVLFLENRRFDLLISAGLATVVLAVWTSPVGMMICSCVIGFFLAAFGPTGAECACLILGPRLFNFGYGYLMVLMGVGWLMGAPAAG